MQGQNKATVIASAPTFIQYLIASLVPVAQSTGQPNDVKHGWVSSVVKASLTAMAFAAPIVEAANPAQAAAIDLGIKTAVALYKAFGWPEGTPATPPAPPAEVPAPQAGPTPGPVVVPNPPPEMAPAPLYGQWQKGPVPTNAALLNAGYKPGDAIWTDQTGVTGGPEFAMWYAIADRRSILGSTPDGTAGGVIGNIT